MSPQLSKPVNVLLYQCSYCTRRFQGEEEANQHSRDTHFRYSCKVYKCLFIGNDPEQLLNHILDQHYPTFDVYKNCSECDMMYTKTHSLMQHMYDKHGITIDEEDLKETVEVRCKSCPNYKCFKEETYAKHMSTNHPGWSLRCPYSPCVHTSHLFWSFLMHIKEDHMTVKHTYHQCPGCGTGFIKYSSLEQHFNAKKGDGEHYYDLTDYTINTFSIVNCTLCNFEYTDSDSEEETYNFYRHIGNAHNIHVPHEIDNWEDSR